MTTTEENFDVVDPDTLQKISVKPRSEVHRDGDWHRSAHVWVANKKGELILQLRCPTKDSWPNCWDISCAGHLSAGDESLEAAIREMGEELGMKVTESDLKYLFTTKKSVVLKDGAFVDNEVQDVYLTEKDGLDLSTLVLQESEVADTKWAHWEDILSLQKARDPSIVPVDLDADKYGRFFKYMEENYPKKQN